VSFEVHQLFLVQQNLLKPLDIQGILEQHFVFSYFKLYYNLTSKSGHSFRNRIDSVLHRRCSQS
jgi:hypothetical protein